ncbi:unnamed protein product [Trifolium pratense]|uniref:Uncharacterized protein n=1 Tax=Trifolium pratense TaxID=57577 RepID=A0ACB0JE03_TRIPR|nr:unnamed protein product [Trifolium pratense]
MQKVFGAWLYSNEIGLFMKDRLASRTFRLTRQKEVAATVCCCFSSIKPFISLDKQIDRDIMACKHEVQILGLC